MIKTILSHARASCRGQMKMRPAATLQVSRSKSLDFYTRVAKATANTARTTVTTPGEQPQQQEAQFLELNIGGQTFSLTLATINNRGDIGLLYKFANETHAKRLKLCQGYDQTKGEYRFERSSMLFHHIYLWYINGIRTQVPLYARDNFIAELSFWGLAKVFYPNFMKRRDENEDRDLSLAEKFRLVRFGEIREKIWHLFNTPESSFAAKILAFSSIFAVLLSNLGLILSSMPEFQVEVAINGTNRTSTEAHPALEYLEYSCIALFSLELLAKFIVCPDREHFFYNQMNLVDFVVILPFYLEQFGLFSANIFDAIQDPFLTIRTLRVMRVLRVVRLFKLSRHSAGVRVFLEVIWETVAQLGVVLIVVAIGVLFFSTLMYYVERNDDNSSPFQSIPITIWWCICTMSTVGYGDMVPESTGGKVVACFAIVMGVLVLSMPITIFVDKFMNAQQQEENAGLDR